MAQAGTGGRHRPLSPHLQIWRWGPGMTVSILHRISGNGLAVAGLGLLLWWLGALAGGAESYATFTRLVDSWWGMVILVGVSWSFFNHLASGVRHFVLDIGSGYELVANARWAIITPLVGILFTAAFWAAILIR